MTSDSRPVPSAGRAPTTRREFVARCGGLLGGGWLALGLPALATLQACSREASSRDEPLAVLDGAEAAALTAFAARILPSDELPGAVEAGVPHFVDRALGTLYPEHRALMGSGLADLDRRARLADPRAAGFASLPPAGQDAVIREVEATPFFRTARMLVVAGMFSDPSHGGNRDGVGWHLLGMEHGGSHLPPFGHYDAPDAGGTEGA